MSLPFLSCLCPTFRRPELLQNSIACYLAQDYPADRRELIILDDAGQLIPSSEPGWRLISVPSRFRSLAEKYNALAGQAQGEYLVVWEDDDVYLPWHLTAHVKALEQNEYSKPSRVLSLVRQNLQEEQSAGRFHGSIAFSRALFERVQGWPLTRRADFDQQFMARLSQAGATADPCVSHRPSYIFRWASTKAYHAQHTMRSPDDETWYERCGGLGQESPPLAMAPKLDLETQRLMRRCAYTSDADELHQNSDNTVLKKNADATSTSSVKKRTSLTILVTTSGRQSLRQTLASIRPQVADGDEILLLCDGPVSGLVRSAWSESQLPGRLIEVPGGPHNDWGHTPRNFALPLANCSYVVHMDDDDSFAAGAFAAIRRAILTNPGSFFIFRMQFADGQCLWKTPSLIPDNVGTPMFVHPRELRWAKWLPIRGGDFAFIRDTIALNPEIPVHWEKSIVALIRHETMLTSDASIEPTPPHGLIYDLGGVGSGGSHCKTVNLGAPADIRSDITDLDSFVAGDRNVKEFHLTHTLEHVPTVQYPAFLRGLFRKLAPGGSVHVVQTDAGDAIRQWTHGTLSFRAMRTVLFTPADRIRLNPYNTHFNMWSAEELARDFIAVGFDARVGDAGAWSFDMTDEFAPDDCHRYHGIPIRNLNVIATKPRDRVPNQIHFVFGLRSDFGGRPFGLLHYLAVKSAVTVNRPDHVFIWCAHRPQGRWWDLAMEISEFRTIQEFDTHKEVPREHYANRADLARLHILYQYGGIYLDLDTICVRPFGDLRQYPCSMGWEDVARNNLCNAVILAEPQSRFVKLMLDAQDDFRPGMWGDIGIVRSGQLAHDHPELVHTVDREWFYWPSWEGGGYELLNVDCDTEFPDAVCHHLWEHAYWDRGLSNLTVASLKAGESNLCRIVERLLDGLSD